MAAQRNRLRTTFDETASLYDDVRPGYPENLFDDVVSLSKIQPGGWILEIGCGYKGPPRPHEVPDRIAEIEDSGLFGDVIPRVYRWDKAYDARGYVRVLSTYSGHRSLGDDTRRRLFRGIADFIDDDLGGRIVKGSLTTLYVAQKQ